MNQKGFVNIVLIVIVVALIGGGTYFALNWKLPKSSTPVIERISPMKAPMGATIAIIGSGFTPIENSLQFGNGFAYINDLVSSDGKTILFTLPESFDTCSSDGSLCAEFLNRPVPGQMYEIVVINTNGRSNAINFTVAHEDGQPTPTPTPKPSPTPKPDGPQVSLKEGQQESSFLLEKIYPDRVTGLNFMEYPIAGDQGYPVTLRIGEIVSNGCTITLTLTRIEGNIATFIKNTDFNQPCPICLAENTQIDTPSGSISVTDLQMGMSVWTMNKSGQRVSGIIIKTSKVQVPPTHQMVHLILDDGREVFVSPGHPTIDGRTVGELAPSDLYDGVSVVSAKRISYDENATYDILPSGDTGFYWANE